jgi:ankyrin repeat protein
MRSITELAGLIRNNKAQEIYRDVEESPMILRQPDDAGVPLVHVLALTNQLASVQPFLGQETLETVWGPGWTVAHSAAKTRALEPLTALLEKHEHLLVWGANNGDTPVHIAAKHGNLDQIHALLNDPSRLAVPNKRLRTPVHVAAANISLHQIRDCLTPGLLAQRDMNGTSAIEVAEQFRADISLDPGLVRRAKWLLRMGKRTPEDVVADMGLSTKNTRVVPE